MDTTTKIYIGLLVIIIITTLSKTYIKMHEEIDDDLDCINNKLNMYEEEANAYYNMDSSFGRQNIKRLIAQEIAREKKNKKSIDYVNASESGIVRGCIIGFLLGNFGLTSGATSALVYGTVSPLMIYLGF